MTSHGGSPSGVPGSGGPDFGDAPRLLTVEQEAGRLFLLRTALAWSILRSMLATARLRLGLVVVLSLLFWGTLYCLFHEAFAFLASLHADVISLLFNAFFSSLMVMLVFSTGILLYSGLYGSAEARLLLTLPARPEAIFSHKFQEALWFSSWGFVLLGSPILVAYGQVHAGAWTYYAMLLPFMLSFVVIPATIGSMLCMLLVGWIPKLRLHALSIGLLASSLLAAWVAWSVLAVKVSDGLDGAWFDKTFGRLAITEQKVLPSWWLSSGLIESSRSGFASPEERSSLIEAGKFLALLISNGLLLQLLAVRVARATYRVGYSHLSGEAPARRQRPIGRFDSLLSNLGPKASRPLRLLLVKDLRLFRRDVSQWSQVVIFFGLLALYFFNVRSFEYNTTYASMIGFLNLAVIGLILSTFTTRFVYPMISLEGRRFWILGLLPVHRDQIVWSKFLFAFVGSLLPCCGLVWLSDTMLGLDWQLLVVHEICSTMLCMGLSGIAVGLGARMPDLRESSPSKIAAGFGGTLSLVISSLFIMTVVIVAALPTHLYVATRALAPDTAARGYFAWLGSPAGIATSVGVVVAIGLTATILPMFLGLRAFRRMELT